MAIKQKSKTAQKPRSKPAPGCAARVAAMNRIRVSMLFSAEALRSLAFSQIESLQALPFTRALVTAEMLDRAAQISSQEIVENWTALETFARSAMEDLS